LTEKHVSVDLIEAVIGAHPMLGFAMRDAFSSGRALPIVRRKFSVLRPAGQSYSP
jgi:hypothetical protein